MNLALGLGILAANSIAPLLSNGLLQVKRPKPVNYQQAHEDAKTVRPVIPYRAPVPYTGGRVRALLIGINYKGTKSELRGCVNDCFRMLGTLQQISFPISECCILVDDPKFPNFTAYPTRANMIKYLAWLVHDVRPGDVLFLHYSGHGGQTKSNGDSEEAYDQCLIPLDYQEKGSILDDDLFNLLVRNLPAGVRMTCVFDCCHSATMLDLPFSFIASNNVSSGRQGYFMKQVRRNNFSNGDVLMFSGCDDAGTSADVGGSGGTGAIGAATQAFTWALLNTAGLNIMDILLKTRELLRQKKFKQVPQLTASKPIDLYKPFSLFGMLNQDSQQMHHVPQQYQHPVPQGNYNNNNNYNNNYPPPPQGNYNSQYPPPQQQQQQQYQQPPPPQQQYNYNYNPNPQNIPPPPPGGYPQALPGPQYGNYNQYNSL